MTLRNLQKWHGAGNDFLVDVIEQGTAPWWTPERAAALCNRTTGVGADGLLIATVGSDVGMQLFNADGSLAEMSGNGIRCLVAAVRRATRSIFTSLDVVTAAGIKSVHITMDGDHGHASVSMGEVSLLTPIEGSLGVANVGNPHVVVLDSDEWTVRDREERAAQLSDQVGGANVEFVRVVGENRLRVSVIERGVGWTQACGTGSCATATVAREAGLSGDDVIVENSGGDLRVQLDGMSATLSGPVQFVANVEWLEG
jgi:diaminopimelate epimerase